MTSRERLIQKLHKIQHDFNIACVRYEKYGDITVKTISLQRNYILAKLLDNDDSRITQLTKLCVRYEAMIEKSEGLDFLHWTRKLNATLKQIEVIKNETFF